MFLYMLVKVTQPSLTALRFAILRATMGKGGQQGSKQNGKYIKKDEGVTKKQDYVQKFKFFGKSILAAYPDEDGVPIYLNAAGDEQAFFKLDAIAKSRTKDNCEFFHRPGMALCLGASSFEQPVKAVQTKVPKGLDEAAVKTLKKTGLPEFAELLEEPEGKAFVIAAKTLNCGRSKKPDNASIDSALKGYRGFLMKDPKKLLKVLSRLAGFSARVYLGATTLAEHLALGEHKQLFAKNIEKVKKQTKEIQAWVKNSSDEDKYRKALVSAFKDKVKKHKKSKEKKKNASDSTDDDSDGEKSQEASDSMRGSSSEAAGSSAYSSSHSKEKKKKGNNKKEKPKEKTEKESKKKRTRKSSDSSSEKISEARATAPKKAEAEAKEKANLKTAAFTTWAQGDIQSFSCEAASLLTSIGILPGGTINKQELEDVYVKLPPSVLDVCPHLGEQWEAIADLEAVPNTDARKLAKSFVTTAMDAETFYESQSLPSGPSTKK
jgi:hypothetical protein